MTRLSAKEFLAADGVTLDVRSPAEYALGHLPGARSFALFSDEERARIGTLYKQQGTERAIEEGLRAVGPRLADMVGAARELALGQTLNLYCWRGGMRSGSVAWLLHTAGLSVRVLQGGYKAYRQEALSALGSIDNLIVLQGPTGSGKTDTLHALAALGEQVLDLEGLACHRGSAFGALGQSPQPTTQQFQNNLYAALQPFDLTKRVWVEGESKSIGRCYLPDELWACMAGAQTVEVDLDPAQRVARLVAAYGAFATADLEAAIRKLRKRLGGLRMSQALEALQANDLAAVAALLLDYYDDSYAHHRITQGLDRSQHLLLQGSTPQEFALQLLRYVDTLHPCPTPTLLT
ncbi:MAG: tRNA 2-selenouridine(34) synthase MnmH [Bacteroidetes bacterium]|nr:tRNA 2-selenouridine(34) synthase MnmH [Bacteroidota bacterium]